MSNVAVVAVQSRSEKRAFIELPWTLYKEDPNWMPPLRMNLKELVGFAKHPFYERNKVQTFLALRNGEPCGRIAAIVNHAHIERYQDRRGFFGSGFCTLHPYLTWVEGFKLAVQAFRTDVATLSCCE